MISSKTPVDATAPANATYRGFKIPPSESFRRLEEERVLTEFKESVVQVWGGPGRLSGGQQDTPNEEVIKTLPGRPFEMPDGWNQVFGPDRFRVAEGIFDAKMALTVRQEMSGLRSRRNPPLANVWGGSARIPKTLSRRLIRRFRLSSKHL